MFLGDRNANICRGIRQYTSDQSSHKDARVHTPSLYVGPRCVICCLKILQSYWRRKCVFVQFPPCCGGGRPQRRRCRALVLSRELRRTPSILTDEKHGSQTFLLTGHDNETHVVMLVLQVRTMCAKDYLVGIYYKIASPLFVSCWSLHNLPRPDTNARPLEGICHCDQERGVETYTTTSCCFTSI